MKATLRVLPLLLAISAGAAQAGVNIKIDDDTFFTIGAQIQPAVSLIFDGNCGTTPGTCTSASPPNPTGNQAPSGNFGFNPYLRRVRLLTGGQIGKQVTFSFGVDMARLGQGGAFTQAFAVIESYLSYQFIDNHYFDMGYFLVPWSRNSLISSAQINTLETRGPAYTLFGGDIGQRELGLQYRAYFLEKHLNVRAAMIKGVAPVIGTSTTAPTNGNDRPAFMGRVGYTILGLETGFSIPGIQFSETPIIAVGVAGYYQNQAGRNLVGPANTKGANVNITGVAIDAHAEYPLDKDMEFVLDGAVYKTYQGDGQANTITSAHAEAGFRVGKIEPTIAWEYKDTDDVQLVTATDGSGTGIANKSGYRAVRFGLSYWVNKHKFNIKGDFSFIRNGKIGIANPDGPNSPYMQKVATIQSQIFF